MFFKHLIKVVKTSDKNGIYKNICVYCNAEVKTKHVFASLYLSLTECTFLFTRIKRLCLLLVIKDSMKTLHNCKPFANVIKQPRMKYLAVILEWNCKYFEPYHYKSPVTIYNKYLRITVPKYKSKFQIKGTQVLRVKTLSKTSS